MTHATCMLTAKNRDQLRNPTLGNRVWATFFICVYCASIASILLCVCIQLDASFMAALPDDIRTEIESAYGQDTVTNPSSSSLSPDKSLHPLMRPEVCFISLSLSRH